MDHAGHHAHESPPENLNRLAFSATLHCLSGCAIGEVLGLVIGTAYGFSDWQTIAIAVVLAFFFGYGLTLLPLLKKMSLRSAVKVALATDTLSIAVMEVVDNGIMFLIPGAMGSHLDSPLFWGSMALALLIAGAAAFPINRWLVSKGVRHQH